jgi:hypothetical protein
MHPAIIVIICILIVSMLVLSIYLLYKHFKPHLSNKLPPVVSPVVPKPVTFDKGTLNVKPIKADNNTIAKWCNDNRQVYQDLYNEYVKLNSRLQLYQTSFTIMMQTRDLYLKGLPGINEEILELNKRARSVNDAYSQMIRRPKIADYKSLYNAAKHYYQIQYDLVMKDMIPKSDATLKRYQDFIKGDNFTGAGKDILDIKQISSDLALKVSKILYKSDCADWQNLSRIINSVNAELANLESNQATFSTALKTHAVTDAIAAS